MQSVSRPQRTAAASPCRCALLGSHHRCGSAASLPRSSSPGAAGLPSCLRGAATVRSSACRGSRSIDRGGLQGQSEYSGRSQHRTGRRHAVASRGPRGTRDVVHGRRGWLGSGESAHRASQSRRTLAHHVAGPSRGLRGDGSALSRARLPGRPAARRSTTKACTSVIAGSIAKESSRYFPSGMDCRTRRSCIRICA